MTSDTSTQSKAGPVGEGDYVVSQGDCMASIADAHGHFWKKLWDLPENRTLRDTRKDPNVLLAGDKVTIPPIETKEFDEPTEKRHRYRRKGVPSTLTLILREFGEPLANEPYRLIIDGGPITKGKTDGEGGITISVPPHAREGKLYVGPPDREREYTLDLGTLDPIVTIRGQKQRLNTMGFLAGCEDNVVSDEFVQAVRTFLTGAGLEPKDELDDEGMEALEEVFRKGGTWGGLT